MKKSFLYLYLTLFSCSLIAATIPEKINLVYVKSPFNLQNMVIKEKKLLEKEFASERVKIVWRDIDSGAQQTQAMASGAIDISAVMNTASLLLANGAGNPIYIATGVARPTENFAILGKPGKKLTIKDLKGKTVAGPRGTVLHQLLLAALAKNGMKPTDVTFKSMSIPASQTALISGQVDAALLAASAVIKSEQAGCHVISSARDLVKVNLVTTVRKGFYDKYPEALARYVKVQREALTWIQSHWQEALQIGAKEHGITLENAKKLAERSNFYVNLTTEDIQGLEQDQTFLLQNGLMRNRINVNKIVLPEAMNPGAKNFR